MTYGSCLVVALYSSFFFLKIYFFLLHFIITVFPQVLLLNKLCNFTIVLDLQKKNVKVVKVLHNSQPVPLLLNSLHLYGTFVTAKKSLGSSPFYSLF